MKLYYAPRTRAVMPRWMLEELAVPYGLVRVAVEAPMFGIRVPTLIDGDVALTRPAAICSYLADKYLEKKLAPRPEARERAAYLKWLAYAAGSLDPPLLEASLASDRNDRVALAQASQAFLQRVRVVETALGESEYLVGQQFTAADVVVGPILQRAAALGIWDDRPSLSEYSTRLAQREAFRRAGAD